MYETLSETLGYVSIMFHVRISNDLQYYKRAGLGPTLWVLVVVILRDSGYITYIRIQLL